MPMTKHEDKYSFKYTFSSASAAAADYIPIPWDADLTAVQVITGSVASISAAYTVRIGSAGTVSVASVTGTEMVAGGVESLALTRTSFTTANSVYVGRTASGTVGVVILGLTFERPST